MPRIKVPLSLSLLARLKDGGGGGEKVERTSNCFALSNRPFRENPRGKRAFSRLRPTLPSTSVCVCLRACLTACSWASVTSCQADIQPPEKEVSCALLNACWPGRVPGVQTSLPGQMEGQQLSAKNVLCICFSRHASEAQICKMTEIHDRVIVLCKMSDSSDAPRGSSLTVW